MSANGDHPDIISKHNQKSIKHALSLHFAIQNSKNFHKFIVKNGAIFNKEQVLSAIVKQVLPNYILPVKYQNDPGSPGDTMFLSSNCWSAIRTIIACDFMVTIPEINVQIEIKIHLDYSSGEEDRLNPLDAIKSAFKKRMSVGENVSVAVDCSDFHSDPGLSDVYFPLWVPQFQRIIVQTTQSVLHLKTVNFSHNKISSLLELTKLNCPKLEELNLSYNEINWPDLIPILPDKIKILWLEGNPLCLSSLSDYVSTIKSLYPNLKKLDGEVVFPENEINFIMRNSFVNNSIHQLVDQFLHHYFKWFLSADGRNAMVHMYHKDASISVSCNLHPSENTAMNNSALAFQSLSRNILRITNYARAIETFKTGTPHTSATLTTFPCLELDSMSTTVDVPYYVENHVLQIIVTGMYRDKDKRMFWISSAFFLQSSIEAGSREWKIVNQLLSIVSPTPEQIRESFGKRNVKVLDSSSFEPTKEEILSQFKELTSMKTSWCEQFLESTRWDLESALQSFVDQHKGDLVPEEAFLQS